MEYGVWSIAAQQRACGCIHIVADAFDIDGDGVQYKVQSIHILGI